MLPVSFDDQLARFSKDGLFTKGSSNLVASYTRDNTFQSLEILSHVIYSLSQCPRNRLWRPPVKNQERENEKL